MTVRLSEQLRQEAGRYSEREGLTVNALIAVALREYLDRRRFVGAPEGAAAGVGERPSGGGDQLGGKLPSGPPVALAAAISSRVLGGAVTAKGKKRRGR